jgi:hypothetical protein
MLRSVVAEFVSRGKMERAAFWHEKAWFRLTLTLAASRVAVVCVDASSVCVFTRVKYSYFCTSKRVSICTFVLVLILLVRRLFVFLLTFKNGKKYQY